MILKLHSCVLFNSLFLCTCLDIIKIKSNVPDFENYIDKPDSVKDSNILRLFKKISPYSKHTKKLLVARVVPHGVATTGLEYDYIYKTLYKPLITIHKSKPIVHGIKDKIVNKMLNSNEYSDIEEPKLEHFVLKEDDNTKELLKPFQTETNKGLNLKVLNNIHKSIKSMDLGSNGFKAYDKVIYLLKDMLRSPQFEKSGEANDPLAPGKTVNEFDELYDNKSKAKKWMPHYPPWNYWTYKKPIHQDVCPGMQVKVGNMCIWMPPH